MQPQKHSKQERDFTPREERRPASATSAETLVDASDLAPGVATGSTVDRSASSTASWKPLLEGNKLDPQKSVDSMSEVSSTGASAISELKPTTNEAYGGGLYGKDDTPCKADHEHGRASDYQSAEGPAANAPAQPSHKNSGKGLENTAIPYIQ